MINLNFPGPVTSEEGFFDRTREWEMIERAFQAKEGAPVIIQGERRIGKTSLQTVAAKRLRETLGFVPLFLPFGGLMRSSDEFAKEILQAFCANLGITSQQTRLFDEEEQHFRLISFGEFWQEIKGLLAETTGQTFLICVDEFDATLKECSNPEEVLDLIQDLTQRRTDLPIRLFLSMTSVQFLNRSPDADPAKEEGSALLSKLQLLESRSRLIPLDPFEYEDMERMVRTLLAPQIDIRKEAAISLFDSSGGHPYIVKLILDCLLVLHGHEASGLVVDEAAIKQAVKEAVDDPRARAVFANLYEVHFNDEQKALILLLAERQESAEHQVQHQANVSKQELKEIGPDYITAAEVLVRRGYLEKDSEGDRYHLRIPFLGRWLHGWERYESEADKRLKDVRRRLRRLEDPWEAITPTITTEEDLRKYGLLS